MRVVEKVILQKYLIFILVNSLRPSLSDELCGLGIQLLNNI